MDRMEQCVRELAEELWREAGRPAGGSDAYLDRASELVAIKDSQKLATRKLAPSERAGPEGDQTVARSGPTGEPVEPIRAVENVGEFPTLTDQGEEQTAPRRRAPQKREPRTQARPISSWYRKT